MANLDTSTLTSSTQIFSASHTLPQIRAIHKTLHVQIEEKATRLRTQVGSSYRDLLGTADTIVQMRGDNDVVQELLGKMGGRCGRAVIGSKASGLAKFVAKENKSEVAVAARLRLLDACVLIGGRILKGNGGLGDKVKRGDRLVLSTKIWALGRLLINNLTEDATDASSRSAIEMARVSLNNLRLRLLRNVAKIFERPGEEAERDDVLNALCAYSLVTSSGSKDALRHLLKVRKDAIGLSFEVEESERERSTDDVVQSLKLYTKTLLDVQALVPGKLSLALAGLKKQPLFADPALKQLEGLRLDVYERWCGEGIQYFTPYIRHDDLNLAEAREMLMDWSETGSGILLEGLKATLEQMLEFKLIMELRTSVLQLWIRDGGKAKGIDPSEMQDDLREAINARMLTVLDIKVGKLHLVGSEISGTLGRWKAGITDEYVSLWDEDGYEEALAGGAAPFVEEVISRLHGRNDAVSKAANCYKSWYHVIDDVKEVVESLRRQRWDNDYDEIEDEETIEARQQLLSKDDPQMLQGKLDVTLDKSFKELENQIQKLWEERSSAPRNGAIAIYFLRVIRDIRSRLPQRPAIKTFGLAMVPSLHSKVATSTSTTALGQLVSTGLANTTVVSRPLWEGEPSLPNQPSPEIFQFLRALSLSMSDTGVDLWTSAAVAVLKNHISEQLCEKWLEVLAKNITQEANGSEEPGTKVAKKEEDEDEDRDEDDEEDDDKDDDESENKSKMENVDSKGESAEAALTPEQRTDLFTQWLFDIALLRRCIGTTKEGAFDEFQDLEGKVYEQTGLDDATTRQRISKLANDFWQRTNLLFGLLT
ncbi:hypothetical protein B0J13DRAFT_539986 [Dactylonectria estremocensis]|uniref:Conserved oligomeric Golgi complex subunit 1 n=1 Tax=Dactylonectria estremocensis TaxID=1079267 RepID=A0A9P9FFC7_9HYPO|nr:hypothetical protein B0J13DRAFT_539986 [Dactylonectria estremocensis]